VKSPPSQQAYQREFERAIKYYIISLGFLGNDSLQSKVCFNVGISFKKWGKFAEAKQWLERSLAIAGGSYEKAQRHLKDLPAEAQTLDFKKTGRTFFNDLANYAAEKTPAKSVSTASHKSDLPVFDEENIGSIGGQKSHVIKYASIDKMIDTIDRDLDDFSDPSIDLDPAG